MRRTNAPTRSQRRRLLVAALTLVALGLFAAAGLSALSAQAPQAVRRAQSPSQMKRLLPRPPGDVFFGERSGDEAASARPADRQRTKAKRASKPDIEMPVPVRIAIPAIGVSAPVIPLGLNPDRSLEVPQSFAETGWFTGGPEPGERGAAVIVGHVDSHRGPAVFYRLRALRRGDVIRIMLKDRSVVRYRVSSALAAPKRRFPTELVYKRTKWPTLRLVTCDGQFDSSTGHYLDNYIVFASIVERA